MFKNNDLDYSYEAQKKVMMLLNVDKSEFFKVVSGINKIYEKNKNREFIIYFTPAFIYKVQNLGFNNYIFCDKIINDDTINDWK